MESGLEQWVAELRAYIADCRSKNPLPDPDSLTVAQEWQRRIEGGALLTWLKKIGPSFLQERQVLAGMMGVAAEPVIVFTSDVPGLVAAREILGEEHERVLYLMHEEFESSPLQSADRRYQWHAHVWSYFATEIDEILTEAAIAKHPIPPECSYWMHHEGTMWGIRAGRGVDHLWKWDGTEPELLEEAFSHCVS